uniref:PA0613 family protein n=1 Tax=Pseudomonas neuropathica TaxID=2730425 RepID=UPI00389AD8CA
MAAGYSGGNMVAMMMESGGQLVRGRRGSRVPLEASLDIERIVKKRLDPELMTVVKVHYFQPDAPLAARLARSGCTRNLYYQRLHDAHIVVEHFLLGEAA